MLLNRKRKEPFRYTFTSPTECTFEIIRINGNPVSSKPAEAALIDLSKSGCKLYTKLNLNATNNRIKLVVTLTVDGELKKYRGTIRWQKQINDSFNYGVELFESEKERMFAEIKHLAALKKIAVL